MKKKQFLVSLSLIVIFLNTSQYTRAQGQISWINYLKFIPDHMALVDTIWLGDTYTLVYKDTEKGITLNHTIAKNGEKSLTYLNANQSDQYHPFFNSIYLDSLDRLRGYNYSIGATQVIYSYLEDGRLEAYLYLIEDTLNKKSDNDFRLTSDSYSIEFHPNGVIKKQYYFLDGPQTVVEYWPNGKIKVQAETMVQERKYCGFYKEYDENGNLIISGNYKYIDGRIPEHTKIGTWKYYENGKLVRKEKF